jgi:hypothetical protein
MSLYRLTYSSQAFPNMSYPDLLDIMQKSEKNNPPVGLTGMLCYGNFMFLQILEGSRSWISQTYHRILQDPRHFNPEIIECTEISQRSFAEWSMKVVELGSFYPQKAKSLQLKYSSATEFQPSTMSPQQCLNFMVELEKLYHSQGT